MWIYLFFESGGDRDMRNKFAKYMVASLAVITLLSGCNSKSSGVEDIINGKAKETVAESTAEGETAIEEVETAIEATEETAETETVSTKKTDYKVEIQTAESFEDGEIASDFVPEKSTEGRWQKNKSGSWNFILNSTNKEAHDTAIQIGEKVYYFNGDGALENEGWAKNTAGNWVYVRNNKWFKGWIDNTYYTDETGMAVGIKEIEGVTYYFNEDGSLKDGWAQTDGKWYYTEKGKVQTGIVIIDGITYGFDLEHGMLTGMQTIGDKKYFFNSDGTAGQGIVDIDGKKHYCEKGEIKTGKVPVKGMVYKFGDDGVMVTGEFVNGVYINADGTADAKKKTTNVGSLADKDGLDKLLNSLPSKLVDEYFITNGWKLIYDTTATGSMEEIEGSGAVSFNNKFMKFHNVDTILHRFGHYIEYTNGVKAEDIEALKGSETSTAKLDEYFNKSSSEYFAELCGQVLNKTDLSSKAPQTEKFIEETLKKYE